MSILSGYKKFKKYLKTTDGYQLISYFTSSDTVNMVDEDGNVTDTTLTESINQVGKGKELTQEEYDDLSEEEKNNGTVYYITDDDGSDGFNTGNARSIAFDNADTNLAATNVQEAIEEVKNNSFSGNYNDLSNKPTSLKNPKQLTFTGGVTGTYDGSAAKSVAIPTTLPANGGNADTVDNKHANDFILKSGGTMTGALNLANSVWNKVGDDAYFGDHNISGCLCIKGISGETGICFFNQSETGSENLNFINGNQLYATQHFGVQNTIWCNNIHAREDNSDIILQSKLSTKMKCYQAMVRDYNDTAWAPIYASGFGQNSSRRVKDNIEEMSDEEARKILLLNPVTYDYKNIKNGTDCRGLIAEDVAPIIPSCVIGDVNCADDDEKAIERIGIDYSKLVPYLIKMIQIQQEEISELKEHFF